MHWAERDREREEKEYLMAKHPAVRDARNYAAAELFRLTGDAKWNALFLETTAFSKIQPRRWNMNWDSLDQGDSAWVYARTDRPGMDPQVKANCRKVRAQGGRHAGRERRAHRLPLGQTPLWPGRLRRR